MLHVLYCVLLNIVLAADYYEILGLDADATDGDIGCRTLLLDCQYLGVK